MSMKPIQSLYVPIKPHKELYHHQVELKYQIARGEIKQLRNQSSRALILFIHLFKSTGSYK